MPTRCGNASERSLAVAIRLVAPRQRQRFSQYLLRPVPTVLNPMHPVRSCSEPPNIQATTSLGKPRRTVSRRAIRPTHWPTSNYHPPCRSETAHHPADAPLALGDSRATRRHRSLRCCARLPVRCRHRRQRSHDQSGHPAERIQRGGRHQMSSVVRTLRALLIVVIRDRLPRPPAEGRVEKALDIAIHHRVKVANLELCAGVFHTLVGM